MADRLRITMEFSKKREQELLLYQELLKYSNPQAIVKDMLLGLLPLPNIGTNDNTEEVDRAITVRTVRTMYGQTF